MLAERRQTTPLPEIDIKQEIAKLPSQFTSKTLFGKGEYLTDKGIHTQALLNTRNLLQEDACIPEGEKSKISRAMHKQYTQELESYASKLGIYPDEAVYDQLGVLFGKALNEKKQELKNKFPLIKKETIPAYGGMIYQRRKS